jgi:DNA-binding NarL/FixJ family response regulator
MVRTDRAPYLEGAMTESREPATASPFLSYRGTKSPNASSLQRGNMSPFHRLRVLIVDDSAVVGSRLLRLLGSYPAVDLLPQAWSVSDARRAFLEGAPDLVVTDLSLPDGSGLEVVRYVKKVWPGTRVAVLTNEDLGPFRRRCLDAGADDCLDKATDFDAVARIVEELLSKAEGVRPPEARLD